jgi:glyoxylase-like metal-dependent hydrolase (beta-lactamase superfamily II)
MTIEHLNAGWLHLPPNPRVCCHCLVVRDPAGVALIDTGIGMEDVHDPVGRVGQIAIEQAGFQFQEADTAVHQLVRRGVTVADVKHVVVTHLDPDHAGGLADFPAARVHVSSEELAAFTQGDPRYRLIQASHGPQWQTHSVNNSSWYGLAARRLELGFEAEVLLVPLFGHTAGHCGVAIGHGKNWTLHVGDAYYLRAELTEQEHPVGQLAAFRAFDNERRLSSLEQLRRLARDHGAEIRMFGYHDVQELPISLGGLLAD